MIGLIGAMQLEVEGLAAEMEEKTEVRIGMDLFWRGRLYGQEAVLAVCGPGKVNAAMCALEMILEFSPSWILNLGVAGSGEEGIGIGDMVVATCAVQHDMDTSGIGDPVGFVSKIGLVEIPCDVSLREKIVKAASTLPRVRVIEGTVATGDQFIHDSATRERIHSLFGAKAVEMEGAAVAHACYMHHVPCGILRSISDNANGQSDMDYPAFALMAAENSQHVVRELMKNL